MKKTVLMMMTAAAALLFGCNESRSLLTKITITSDVKEVYVGSTAQLTASVEPADVPEAVVWSSSDEKTASVDQKGVVTGIKEGTVTIKLASKADENMCAETQIAVVKNPNPVTVASVVITDGEMAAGEEVTVKAAADENGAYTAQKAFGATVSFSDGSQGRYDETVSWVLGESQPEGAFELSAEGVLSFNLAEKTGTDAALGSAEIEAVSNYDGTTKTAVRINMVDASAPDSLEIVDESGYGFEGGTLALFEGGSGVKAQVFVNPTSKPQEAVWSVEPAGAVKILLPEGAETEVGESAVAKVLLKRGVVGEEVVDAVVTVTQDGVSASLSVSFPEAAITLGGYEDNRWIEGETLTLTAADASFDITSIGGTPVEGNVWTVPAPTAGVDSEDTSIDCECLSVYGESFTVSVAGKVYSSEHIRYDGDVFQTVQVFDFTSTGVGSLSEVKFKDKDDSEALAWPTDTTGGHAHVTLTDEGSSFQVSDTNTENPNKDIVVLPIADLDWTLMMLDVKWSGEGTKPNMYVGNATYGYSFYKLAQGKSFFLGHDKWNPKDGSSYAIAPPAGEFNQYWVYDDGTNRSMRLNEESIYHATASFGDGKKLATETAVQNMTFGNDQGTATFTIKTVAFYKAAE